MVATPAWYDPASGHLPADGYSIEEQGEPPDVVLEVASVDHGSGNWTRPRSQDVYAGFGVAEYWRLSDPIQAANTTTLPWPGITWSTASTSPSKLSSSETAATGATARLWG